MKKVTALIILFALASGLHSQSMYDTYSGFTVPTTGTLPVTEVHPSLYFTAADTQSIRLRQNLDSRYSSLWSSITSNINSFKTKTASSQSTSNLPRMAKYCAFGWIINKDATAKSKAIEALMIAFDNVPRTASSANFDGSYDEIYRATWLQNFCEAYDWVKSELSPIQDSTIRAKLTAEVVLLVNNMRANVRYAPRPHNHRSKPAYAVGTAALTFSSDSRAQSWLDSALINQNTVTKYQYSADGIYREGNHYNIYSMVNGLPFLWHYKNVSGVDLFPNYIPVWENAVKVRFGRGLLHTYEDSYLKPFMTHMAAAAYTTTSTSLHSSAKLSEVLQWNFLNTYLPSQNYTGATNDVTWDIEEYLLYDYSIAQTMPDVTPSINLQYGQTILRKNWNYNDPANRVLVFHGVAEADNHNHPDQLAIMFEAENAIMATTTGYGPDGFSDVKRNSWYLQPFAKNIVTVDDLAPTDAAVNQTPPTAHFVVGKDNEYVEKRITFTNNASWNRGISFPHKNYYVVRDVVTSTSSRTHKWFMHARGTLSTSGINAKWTLPSDTYGSAAIFDLFAVSSNGASFTTNSGYVSFANGHEASAPYVSLQNNGTETQFLSVLYPRSTGSTAPTVSSVTNGNAVALSVAYSDTTDIHVTKKDYTTLTAGGITTDATYGMVSKKSSSVILFSVVEGTSLQYNGSTLLNSSDRVTLMCAFLNSSKVYIDAESLSAATSLQVKLPFSVSALTDVYVNGTSSTYSSVDDSTINIPSLHGNDIVSVGSGTWSTPSVWSSGVVPASADNVEISTDDTITIDVNNAVCNNLSVHGKLAFSNDDARAITVNGNITISSAGDFNAYQTGNPTGVRTHTVTINGNLIVTNGGKFDMRKGSGSNVAVGTVVFLGSQNSTISLSQTSYSSSVEEFNSVTINKSGGAKVILASGNLFMSNNSSTGASVLTLSSGIVETGNNVWVHLSTASGGVTGGSVSSYINGALGRGGNTGGGTSRTFEVGDANGYRPVIITTNAGIASGGYVVVRCISGDANNSSTFSGGIDRVSAVRYYNIMFKQGTSATTSTGISKTALSYAVGDGVISGNTDLRVAYSTNNRTAWTGVGQSSAHMTSVSSTPTYITPDNFSSAVNLSDGGNFYTALANAIGGENPLPVEIIDFSARVNHKYALLVWKTAVETNSVGFDIERLTSTHPLSYKGEGWEKIGFVESHGTSNAPHEYNFIDNNFLRGIVRYRLKIIDRDGSWKYSTEVTIEVGTAPHILSLADNYPNPFNPVTAIEFTVPENGYAALSIFNPLGQKVAEIFSGEVEAGRIYYQTFDARNLSSGLYFYRLEFGGKRITKKMMLVR